MSKKDDGPRFGPERWVTMRETGEHVKVECWSPIATAYRVRSRKSGLQFVSEDELVEISEHPEAHLGRHWRRCAASGCGAPLTPELPVCPQCQAPTCTCGRCECVRRITKAPGGTSRKKAVARAH
jgi:hypothetical protein